MRSYSRLAGTVQQDACLHSAAAPVARTGSGWVLCRPARHPSWRTLASRDRAKAPPDALFFQGPGTSTDGSRGGSRAPNSGGDAPRPDSPTTQPRSSKRKPNGNKARSARPTVSPPLPANAGSPPRRTKTLVVADTEPVTAPVPALVTAPVTPPSFAPPPDEQGDEVVVRGPTASHNRISASFLTFGAPIPWGPGGSDAPGSAVSVLPDSSPSKGTGLPPPELVLQLKRSPEPEAVQEQLPELDFDERRLPMDGFLQLRSQEEEITVAALAAVLPPLQSVLELTTAFRPPTKSLEATVEETTATETATATATAATALPVGRHMPDGQGVLADGTTWVKVSGEELGPNGFWKRWTRLSGHSADRTVSWEETWWEASDWTGLKELGATKTGTSLGGGAWRENWIERAHHDEVTAEMVITRTAHKWARADGATGEEWEEKWGETHKALGTVNKWADKWARQGPDVWHEKWGEDYDGRGACTKWTDKWAERDLPGGAREQWGDKWTEQFAHGKGSKHGEVWSCDGGGGRYNRWWNEEHLGNGSVRKYGNSTSGEYWDNIEEMDTYYNPIPHFGFNLAVRHSPGLWKVAERPRKYTQKPPRGALETDEGSAAAVLGFGWGEDDAAPGADAAAGAGLGEETDETDGMGTGLDALDWGQPDVPTSAQAAEATWQLAGGGASSQGAPASWPPREDPLAEGGSVLSGSVLTGGSPLSTSSPGSGRTPPTELFFASGEGVPSPQPPRPSSPPAPAASGTPASGQAGGPPGTPGNQAPWQSQTGQRPPAGVHTQPAAARASPSPGARPAPSPQPASGAPQPTRTSPSAPDSSSGGSAEGDSAGGLSLDWGEVLNASRARSRSASPPPNVPSTVP